MLLKSLVLAHIYIHHPLLQDMIECESLLKLMAKHSTGEMASFLHYFVMLGPLSSNRLSHFPGPVIYNSGYRQFSSSMCRKFHTEI